MTRVLIVNDHPILRLSLALLLDAEEDVEAVGAASDGADAVKLVAETSPDVVLMDLSMPGVDGVQATRSITASGSAARIVVLTSFSDRDRILEALDAGAIGYLLKEAEPDDLLRGVRAAARDDWPIDPRAARLLLGGGGRPSGPRLSDREKGGPRPHRHRAGHVSTGSRKARETGRWRPTALDIAPSQGRRRLSRGAPCPTGPIATRA